MPIIATLNAEPDLKHVHSRMGFKPGRSDIPESMQPLVAETIEVGRKLCTPRACYEYRSIRHDGPETIEVGGIFRIKSRKLSTWMEGCSGFYLVAVTLGHSLDQEVARLAEESDMTRAFLLNAYGAEAAEALMKSLNERIKTIASEEGHTITKRYSPGYGDWHISSQRELLADLGAERIGIQLTENHMMIPEKSVSAVIGARRDEEGRH